MLGDHGFATRWQLVDDRDVEVAIECHRQGAGNRCCRHNEHMWRVGTLAPQLGTLGHTEAVLFVDNDHS